MINLDNKIHIMYREKNDADIQNDALVSAVNYCCFFTYETECIKTAIPGSHVLCGIGEISHS